MVWTFRLNEDGDIEAHDGERVRALIVRPKRRGLRWRVYRMNHRGELGGCEQFKTLDNAKRFCDSNPGVWGR